MATTTAGACTHLLVHGIGHLLIAGSSALLDGEAEVLIHHRKHIVKQLAGFQESLAELIFHHS